jgi:hypothetical protein
VIAIQTQDLIDQLKVLCKHFVYFMVVDYVSTIDIKLNSTELCLLKEETYFENLAG